MAVMALRRPAVAGLVVATLLAGCASQAQPAAPHGCTPDGTASSTPPHKPDPVGTAKAVAGSGGPVDAQVTSFADPLPEGRDALDNAELMPDDERRGQEVFEVPAGAELSWFAIDGLVTDASKPAGPVKLPAYQPGNWPRIGTTQVADRLPGERLRVTPLKVMDPTPATAGVKPGRRAYSVQFRLQSVGTKAWPFSPEITTTFIDSRGRNWIPGFVTTTAAPPFDPLHGEPGGRPQTGWVTGEIPGDATIVAMVFSPYSGVVYAWRT